MHAFPLLDSSQFFVLVIVHLSLSNMGAALFKLSHCIADKGEGHKL